jgi:hypothetical protein
MSETKFPLRTRVCSALGMTVLVAAIAYSVYNWLDALAYPALDEHLYVIFLHTPDAVSSSDLATFAASLVVVVALYHAFDPDLRRRSRTNLRRAAGGARRVLRVRARSVDK